MSINVKRIGHPYNLGRTTQWSIEDLDFLLANGATINEVDYVHIPLDKIEGTVPLGRKDNDPANLRIAGRKVIKGRGLSSSHLIQSIVVRGSHSSQTDLDIQAR